ncbi:transposase [Salinibacter ruber]|uniref:transposase n=1 Tax=Salinibacter ruber TaxID=146919 RepID=UPI0035BE545E
MVDSFPIPLCQPVRHGRVRLPGEDGAYFGRSAKGWFFGFQVHALIHQPTGAVLTAIPLPGNWDGRRSWDDRWVVRALALSTAEGILLGDQGYSGKETFDWPCGQAQTLRAGAIR